MSRRTAKAFTLVELLIVIAIIGLLATIAIPNYVRVREHTQANNCINNLRLIDAAKQQWALELRKTGADEPSLDELESFLVRGNAGRVPVCPAGGTAATFDLSYQINPVTNQPACLIRPDSHKLPL